MLLAGLFGLVLVAQLALATDVYDLTDSNFDSTVANMDLALVEFYAPWCGHCKRLAPEYERAATILKSNDPPVPLVRVDCTAEKDVCGRFDVSGYPTLKIFKNGKVASDYDGPREADGIVKYLKSRAGPSAKELLTVADAEKFLANSEHSVVAFLSSADSALASEYKRVADQLSERYRFAFTSQADILDKYNRRDQVVIYQPPRLQVKLESAENVYTGAVKSNDLKQFIENELHGIVGHRTPGNAADFRAPLVVVYYNIDFVKDVKGSNYVRNRVIKVAQKLRGEGLNLRFAVASSNDFRQELHEFGIEAVNGDAKHVGARDAKGLKFKLEADYSPEALEAFARELNAGTLEAYMKSEPLPASNDEPVKVLVGRNFDEIVNDPTKDVLVEFYAPWCGHCKTLAPKYDELATKLKGESNIVIAKMDATANDVPPQFDVKGFPTLYFVPRDSKQSPRQYQGGREVADFIKYLAKEATEPLVGYTRDGKKQNAADKKSEL